MNIKKFSVEDFSKIHLHGLRQHLEYGGVTVSGWHYGIKILVSIIESLDDLELRDLGSYTILSKRIADSIMDPVISISQALDKISIDRTDYPDFFLQLKGIFNLYDKYPLYKYKGQFHWGYIIEKKAWIRIKITNNKKEPFCRIVVEKMQLEDLVQKASDGERIYKVLDAFLRKAHAAVEEKMKPLHIMNTSRVLMSTVLGIEKCDDLEKLF